MIPRYAPTYAVKELLGGLILSANPNIEIDLITQFESLYDVEHVFSFGSGREALYAILKAYNRPGKVLIPAYNCIVVPEAIQYAGYSPVFVDIDNQSLNMTAEGIKEVLNPDVRAILLTHIFGVPCELEEILNLVHEQDILIIEDAAPALGAEYHGQFVGTFGDSAIISFQSTKVISGEVGGVLIVNNDELAGKVRNIQLEAKIPAGSLSLFSKALARKIVTDRKVFSATQFGYRTLLGEPMFEVVTPQVKMPSGYFTHCPKFSSALVIIQMNKLDWNLSRRRKIANIYYNELSGNASLILPKIPEDCSPSWIQFPIRVEDKWAFYKHMQRNNVDVTWTYRYSCAQSFGLNGYHNALSAAKSVLGLPTSPTLSDDDARYICTAAEKFSPTTS